MDHVNHAVVGWIELEETRSIAARPDSRGEISWQTVFDALLKQRPASRGVAVALAATATVVERQAAHFAQLTADLHEELHRLHQRTTK